MFFLICGAIVACSNVQLCKLDTKKTEETGLDAFEMNMLGCGWWWHKTHTKHSLTVDSAAVINFVSNDDKRFVTFPYSK